MMTVFAIALAVIVYAYGCKEIVKKAWTKYQERFNQ